MKFLIIVFIIVSLMFGCSAFIHIKDYAKDDVDLLLDEEKRRRKINKKRRKMAEKKHNDK